MGRHDVAVAAARAHALSMKPGKPLHVAVIIFRGKVAAVGCCSRERCALSKRSGAAHEAPSRHAEVDALRQFTQRRARVRTAADAERARRRAAGATLYSLRFVAPAPVPRQCDKGRRAVESEKAV